MPALSLSEENWFKSIFGQFPDTLILVNCDGIVQDCQVSPEFPFDITPETANGSHLKMILPLAFAEQLYIIANRAIESGEPCIYEYVVDGLHFRQCLEVKAVPTHLEFAILIFYDVTERKWSEDALRASEKHLRQLINGLYVGVMLCGPNAEVLLMNDTAQRLFGIQPGKLPKASVNDMEIEFIPEPKSPFSSPGDIVETVIKTQRAVKNAVLGVRRPLYSDRVWLLINAEPEQEPGEPTRQVTVTLSDVTDFHFAEMALRDSEEQYQALVDNIRDVIFLIDLDHQCIFLNPAWNQITDFDVQMTIGKDLLEFVYHEDISRLQTSFQDLISEKSEAVRLEIRLLNTAGDTRWVEYHGHLVRSADGISFGIGGSLVDIQARKRSEEQAAELAAQSTVVDTLAELFGNFAHDIRTPLSNMNTYLYLLRSKLVQNREIVKYLDILEFQVRHLVDSVEEIRQLAYLDSGAAKFDFTEVDLNRVVLYTVASLDKAFRDKKQTLSTRNMSGELIVRGDADWLNRLVTHLLVNAIQFTEEGGEITLHTARQGDMVLLEVSDTGRGISTDQLPYIFDRFYRADTSRPMAEGNVGLGLTIVKQIATAHGGNVAAESSIGLGSVFRIQLPAG